MSAFDKAKFAELLKKAQGERSINQYWLESEVSATYISKLLRRLVQTPPGPQIIQKLAAKAHNGVTYQDFMIAAGHIQEASTQDVLENMIKNPEAWTKIKNHLYHELIGNNQSELIKKMNTQYKISDDSALDAIEDFISKIELFPTEKQIDILGKMIDFQKINEIKPVERRIKIPIIGTVCAGNGGYALEEDLGYEYTDINDIHACKSYFWLKVKGDSMINEGIFENDLALVCETPDVENGALAVVLVDNEEGRIKRIIKKDNAIVLQAANPAYPASVFVGHDINRLRIIGEVIETKRHYK
ncbi:MAG: hypothetical protein H6Q67_2331 [Firmicutes bacterium]|nr:hypothetical protein [Bacillota bacterium]